MKKKQTQKLLITILVLVLYFIFVLKIVSVQLTLSNFLGYLVFLLIIIIIYYNDIKQSLKDFKKNKKNLKTILLYFLIFFLLSTVVSNVLINIISKALGMEFLPDASNKTIFELFKIVPFGTLFVFFFTVIYTPIVEEFAFRKSIRDVLTNKIVFIVLSSLLSWYFQVTLLNPSSGEFVLAISALLNSIFASFVLLKHNNILYCIFPRMLYNLVICAFQIIYQFIK